MQEKLGALNLVRVPALWGSEADGTAADAFLPGVVNYFYVTSGTSNKIVMPKPFGPRKAFGAAVDDVFEHYLEDVLPDSVFIDDWNGYHRLDGETHCGTNSRRAIPTTAWWEL
jgi:protein-arginine deiminase